MTVRGDLLAFEILSIPPDSIEIEKRDIYLHGIPSAAFWWTIYQSNSQ